MLRFARRAFKNHHDVGAFFPSGASLARSMTQWITKEPMQGPRRVLEVGAGTGAFTGEILRNLKPGDRFDVVELHEDFCAILEQDILEPFRRKNPDITVELHQISILEAPLEGPYDDIICGLPFNNFAVSDVDHLFNFMLDYLSSSGHMVYFSYVGMSKFKWPFSFIPRLRRSLLARRKLMNEIHHRGCATRSMVLRNLPPAWACSLRAVPSATITQS